MRISGFKRVIGPISDLRELEYISALHQSGRLLRKDGSITATDVVHFLSSRYGIVVTEKEVTKQILAGLGGGDDEDECIDITEIVAILLIPFLLKMTKTTTSTAKQQQNCTKKNQISDEDKNPKFDTPSDIINIIEEVATMVLSDSMIKSANSLNKPTNEAADRKSQQLKIDNHLVKGFFLQYGEHELANDDQLINEMVLAATGGKEGAVFNAESFLRGLTFDVEKYDTSNELKLTSNYYDVFQTHYSTASEGPSESIHDENKVLSKLATSFDVLKNKFTASLPSSQSDNTAIPDVAADDMEVQPSQPVPCDMEVQSFQYIPSDKNIATTPFPPPYTSSSTHCQENLRPVKKLYTAPQIDSSVDTYMSNFYTVLLWLFFVMTSFAYLPNPTGTTDWIGCEEDYTFAVFNVTVYKNTTSPFRCKVENRIIDWIVIGLCYCLFGTLFIYMGSLSNSVYAHDKKAILISWISVTMATAVPFASTLTPPSSDYRGYQISRHGRWPALALGMLLVLTLIIQLLGMILSKSYLKRHSKLARFLVYGNIISESNLKQAAAYKINSMVKNARDFHKCNLATDIDCSDDVHGRKKDQSISISDTEYIQNMNINDARFSIEKHPSEENNDNTNMNKTFYDKALFNFEKSGGEVDTDECGGLYWTYSNIISNNLYKKEGVWVSTRIIVGALAQFIISLLVPVLGITVTRHFVNYIDDKTSHLPDTTHTLNVLELAGKIGTVFATVTCMYLSLIPIPSAVATSLKFRSGVIPSLQDEKLKRYRYAPDSVSKILGAMFWGVFYSGAGVYLFIGTIVFLVLHQDTREWCTRILASLIGFSVTFGIRALLLFISRRMFYEGLYRTNPVKAIFTILALECGNVGLAAGFMLVRMFKLMAVAIMYVGRVDTPVLAEGVGAFGPIKLDDTAILFRRDIVAHEAHRHPYIESLGVMVSD